MQESSTTFQSGDLTLTGTIARPAGAADGTAAVLISGSGPVDRDSNVKRMPIGVARHLATALADAGVVSLRYDKRGVGGSGGDYQSAGLRDNVDDAAAAVGHLRGLDGVDADRVVAIGHSEGALIALELAAGAAPVAGAAMLAGAAQSGEAVLRWQAGQLEGLLPKPVRGLLRLLRVDVAASQLKRMDRLKASTEDVIRMQGVVKVNAKWFKEFMAHDPAPALAKVAVPLLAITGAHDVQVDPADLDVMRDLVTAPLETHLLDGVNHILRLGDPSPTTYKKQINDPLDPRVAELLADWIGRLPHP